MHVKCYLRHNGHTITLTSSSSAAVSRKATQYYPGCQILTIRKITQHREASPFAGVPSKAPTHIPS